MFWKLIVGTAVKRINERNLNCHIGKEERFPTMKKKVQI